MVLNETKYGQKLIQMVKDVADQHFNVVEDVRVEKTDDAIYVSFLYSQETYRVKHAFEWNLLAGSKTKKLRDLKRALNNKLSEIK